MSVVGSANNIVHYQNIFPRKVIDKFDDEAWVLLLSYRLTAIATKFYNTSALARGRDNNLCPEMVNKLTARGGSYEFSTSLQATGLHTNYCNYVTKLIGISANVQQGE